MKHKITFENLIYIVCIFTNLVFMSVHIIYLILALVSKTYIFAYINIFSTLFYLLLFLLIKNKKFELFALFAGVEIIAYMTLAAILAGYNAGYHLTFIGLCTLAFVTKYFLKDKKFVINPIIVSAIFAIDFIFLYFYCKYNPPIVEFPELLNTGLYIGHSLIVFIFCVGFLVILVEYIFKLEKIIRKESETDRLTQIPNRRALSHYFEVLGDQKSNYLLAIFDIDNFKKFNDVNGHLCGDYILKEISLIAKNNSLNDFVSRWGGEEFVIISKIENSLDETYKKIDSLREKIDRNIFKYNNKELHSTVTVGIASYVENDDLDKWIERADLMLYKGKKSGKNKTVYE